MIEKMVYRVLEVLVVIFFCIALLTKQFIFLGCLLLGYLLMVILLVKKPSEKNLEIIKDTYCCHITDSKNLEKIKVKESKIFLKTSKGLIINLFTFFRPSVYFFLDRPTDKQIKTNLHGRQNNVSILVKIGDLDKRFIRIRKYDNTLIYLKSYEGRAIIKNID